MSDKKISNIVKTFVTTSIFDTIKDKITSDMTVSEEVEFRGNLGFWIADAFADSQEDAKEVVLAELDKLTEEEVRNHALSNFYIRKFQDIARLDLQAKLGLAKTTTSIFSRKQQSKLKDILAKATADERVYANESTENLLEILDKYK